MSSVQPLLHSLISSDVVVRLVQTSFILGFDNFSQSRSLRPAKLVGSWQRVLVPGSEIKKSDIFTVRTRNSNLQLGYSAGNRCILYRRFLF